MKTTWALQDAKNQLSEVVDQALREGPQIITRRGKETAVIVSVADFQKMTTPRGSLISFFKNSPLTGAELDMGRTDDYGRDLVFGLIFVTRNTNHVESTGVLMFNPWEE